MRFFIVGARLAHPERAAALSLRADVALPWLAAPDRDVDAMAEVATGVAAAGVLDVRVETRGVHGAIVTAARRCEQRLSRRRPPDGRPYPNPSSRARVNRRRV